jgi:F-type H+-transporting ATPase subunit b
MHVDGLSIAFQALNFLLLAYLLHRFLWRPVTAMLDRRKKELDDAAAKASAETCAAEESRQRYEAKLDAVEVDRAKRLAEAEVEIAEARARALAEAKDVAKAEIEAARRAIEEERRAATDEVTREAIDLAVALSRRMLADLGSGPLTGAFLDRITARLDAMTSAEINGLSEDLGDRGALSVATAPALDAEAQARFRARLSERLGPLPKIDFVVDDALVAGVEVRFPHARIASSLAHGLEAARKELVGDVGAR